MIRKFFAFIFLLLFVFLLPPLLVFESVSETFLNEQYMRERIIPESFPVVSGMFEELLSGKPEAKMLKERLETLSKERYAVLLQPIVSSFFNNLEKRTDSIELNLSSLKSELREIPDRFIITKNSETVRTVSAIWLTKKFLPVILLIISLILLGSMVLIIYSPISKIFKWMGAATLGLTVFLALFLISMSRLGELIPLDEAFTSNQIDLVHFVLGYPLEKLKLWTFFIGAAGILLMGSGIVVQSKRGL